MMKEITITIKPENFKEAYRLLVMLKNSTAVESVKFGNEKEIKIKGQAVELDKVINNLNKHV